MNTTPSLFFKDTEPGDDFLARLNVLTELDEKWSRQIEGWNVMNSLFVKNNFPSREEENLIYLIIIGSFPLETDAGYEDRLKDFLRKTISKERITTDTTISIVDIESRIDKYITNLFNPLHTFTQSLISFIDNISDYGIINSLSHLTLKITSGGDPDIGQISNCYDFSFVRQPGRKIDYDHIFKAMQNQADRTGKIQYINELWNTRKNGNIRQWLISILLNERKLLKQLFQKGEIIPLNVSGKLSEHIIAFTRRYKNENFITIIPAFLYTASENMETTVNWSDTLLHLPLESDWINPLDEKVYSYTKEILISRLLKDFPVACLKTI